MSNLSTDAIVTIASTIPGLLVSSLSAWFAYAALRRRHVARNDIETSTIELVLMRLDAASLIALPTAPQLPHIPVVLPQLEGTNLPVVLGRPERHELDQISQE